MAGLDTAIGPASNSLCSKEDQGRAQRDKGRGLNPPHAPRQEQLNRLPFDAWIVVVVQQVHAVGLAIRNASLDPADGVLDL